MDAAATIERYVARSECGECGYDGELIVEMGGGIVSVTCPACYFSASAPAAEVGPEWAEFMDTLEDLPAEDRHQVVIGAALGVLRTVALFLAGLVLPSPR
ncbi:MAG TPA: hypothetical protein VIM28_10470 [Solirubrobacterales bacterium]